ncbi:hypothetical protein V8E36_004561 [Tilletia maclaganii]
MTDARVLLKCRLHSCHAYRNLALGPVRTLADVQQRAAEAWQLPHAQGLLLALQDSDGDDVAVLGQREWEAVLANFLSLTAAAPRPVMRISLVQDPRAFVLGTSSLRPLSTGAAGPTTAAAAAPAPGKGEPEDEAAVEARRKKAEMDKRNEALADSFNALLARSRNTDTVQSRARDVAGRLYHYTRSQVPDDAQDQAGPSSARSDSAQASTERAQVPGTTSDSGLAAQISTSTSAPSELDQKRDAWRSRATQLYGSLVAVPPTASTQQAGQSEQESSNTAQDSSAEPGESLAPPALQEPAAKLQPGESHAEAASAPPAESAPTAASPIPPEAEADPGRIRVARPQRPIEEVNAELQSAWERLLPRTKRPA